MKIINPFLLKGYAGDRYFCDREKETRELLERNQDFLIALSKELALKGSLKPLEVVLIANKFGHDFEVKEENYMHLAGYEELLNDHE